MNDGPSPANLQVPGVYRRRIGDIVVTALSDGFLDAPYEVIANAAPDEIDAALSARFRPTPPRISVNAFLIQSAGRTALIDTGSGSSMGPTLGWLPANLVSAGVSPAGIDSVLLTHMHPDHSNGLCDAEGRPVFSSAELVMHEDEVAHWSDDSAMARADERQRVRYFQAARAQLEPYRSQLRTIRSGEVFPGVTAMPIPGHTPGHTAYLVASGRDELLIWGDIVHVPEVQTARPQITMVFDTDPDAAAATRQKMFERVAAERLLVTGMHLHFPGFAHVVADRGRYELVPEHWSFVV